MTDGTTIGMVIVVIALLIVFAVTIGGWMIEYSVEYWISMAKGEPVDVSYGISCVAALFIGWNIGIPAAVITWISSMVWDRPTIPVK